MKKFSKVAAVCAAVAVMVVGATATVMAAPSVTTVSATATELSNVTTAAENGPAIAVEPVAAPVIAATQKVAATLVESTVKDVPKGEEVTSVTVEKIFELTPAEPLTGPTNIHINVPTVAPGQKVVVLHQKADATWESVPVLHVGAGVVVAQFTSLSPVAIVTYGTSPKTAEVSPVAGVICVMALLGAAVCVKKYVF